MTSNSGEDGYCGRCGLANNNHYFSQCPAFKKNGRCPEIWVRCTAGEVFGEQYFDCHRCWAHPAAPPDDFWGTLPSDDFKVETANSLGIPLPADPEPEEELRTGKGHRSRTEDKKESKHGRTFSEESLDPLSLEVEPRIAPEQREKTHMRQLSNESEDPLQIGYEQNLSLALEEVHLQEQSSDVEKTVWVETIRNGDHIHFDWAKKGKSKTKTYKSTVGSWVESVTGYEGSELDCFKLYDPESGITFCTWTIDDAQGSSSQSDDVWVDIKRKGDYIYFYWGDDGKGNFKSNKTKASSWVQSTTEYKGKEVTCYVYESRQLGRKFFTWENS